MACATLATDDAGIWTAPDVDAPTLLLRRSADLEIPDDELSMLGAGLPDAEPVSLLGEGLVVLRGRDLKLTRIVDTMVPIGLRRPDPRP